LKSENKIATRLRKLFAIKKGESQRGAALLMVATVTAVLMAVVIEFSYSTRVDLSLSKNFRDDARATFLARAGIDAAGVVLLYDYQQDEPKIDYVWTDMSMSSMPDELWSLAYTMPLEIGGGMVIINIEDELSKVNINQFVNKSGVRVKDIKIDRLAAWIEHFEIDPDIADEIAFSIVDWTDLDDDPGDIAGVESDFYKGLQQDGLAAIYTTYETRNAPFCSPDELKMVSGVTDEIYNRLAPFITIFPERTDSGKYPINVNTASEDVLFFLDEEIDEQTVAAIVDHRMDEPFKNSTQFKKVLIDNGIPTAKAAEIATRIAVRSDYFMVKSEAIIDNVSKVITAVLKRKGKKNDIEIVFWQAF
jgi:general secretion pathway protein K